tara:strand:+ start:733 stop:1911 length:1179 start_codon:yes stop_codon:yes gene_type:complete
MRVSNKSFLTLFVLFFIFIAFEAYSKEPVVVSKIRFADIDGGVRVVVDLNDRIKYEYLTLGNPNRFVIDLDNVVYDKKFSFPRPKGVINDVRFGSPYGEVSRIVFDLNYPVNVKGVKILKPSSGLKRRLSFDLNVDESRIISKKNKNKIKEKKDLVVNSKKSKRKITIVIDPGHGGKDPGTSYPGQFNEKDVVLRFSSLLKKNLQKNPKYRVFLTREDDSFVPLSQRVDFANMKSADLFISIHADASRNNNVKGFSVYTLSEKGIDRESEKLAKREDSLYLISREYKRRGINLENAKGLKENYLIKVAMQESQLRSTKFAGILVDKVSERTRLLKRPQRYAGFAVLKSAYFPSILVELGFVTNENDRKNLLSRNWLTRISYTFIDAINEYFN